MIKISTLLVLLVFFSVLSYQTSAGIFTYIGCKAARLAQCGQLELLAPPCFAAWNAICAPLKL